MNSMDRERKSVPTATRRAVALGLGTAALAGAAAMPAAVHAAVTADAELIDLCHRYEEADAVARAAFIAADDI